MIIDEDVRNRDLQEQLQKHNTKNFIEFIERFLGDKQLKNPEIDVYLEIDHRIKDKKQEWFDEYLKI